MAVERLRLPPRGWNIVEAVELLRELEPHVNSVGLSTGLTGSVARTGGSRHDLDLIVFPYCVVEGTRVTDLSPLHSVLKGLGWQLLADKDRVHEGWRKDGSQDTKHVEVWRVGLKRVDLIFLQ